MNIISDVAQYLDDNSIGTLGTDLFYGTLPDTDGDLTIAVLDTGGVKPDIDLTDIQTPTIQVFVRSSSYDTGKAKIDAIRGLLHNKYEFDIGSFHILAINLISEGGHLGKNESGKHEFSINFIAKLR